MGLSAQYMHSMGRNLGTARLTLPSNRFSSGKCARGCISNPQEKKANGAVGVQYVCRGDAVGTPGSGQPCTQDSAFLAAVHCPKMAFSKCAPAGPESSHEVRLILAWLRGESSHRASMPSEDVDACSRVSCDLLQPKCPSHVTRGCARLSEEGAWVTRWRDKMCFASAWIVDRR